MHKQSLDSNTLLPSDAENARSHCTTARSAPSCRRSSSPGRHAARAGAGGETTTKDGRFKTESLQVGQSRMIPVSAQLQRVSRKRGLGNRGWRRNNCRCFWYFVVVVCVFFSAFCKWSRFKESLRLHHDSWTPSWCRRTKGFARNVGGNDSYLFATPEE